MTLENKKHNEQRQIIIASIVTATFLIGITFAIPSSSASGFDLTGLKAYYTFDETSGDLINEAANAGSVDSLGSSADGQLESGVVQGKPGLIGNSYDFPGSTNGQVELGTSKSQFRFLHDSPTMRWSTNIWMNATLVTTSSSGLFSTAGGSTSDVGLDLAYDSRTTTERIVVFMPQGSLFQPNVIVANTPQHTLAPDGQWHMITVTHDQNLASNNMNIYVDGVLVHTATKSGVTPIASNHHEVGTIGSYAGSATASSFAFDGNLDELSIWNRVLSPTEISDLYNSGQGLALDAPSITEETFSAEKDSFLRQGTPNRNEGANEIMQLRANGNNRALVEFNQTDIENTIGTGTLENATLRLYIEDNFDGWGASGRTIDAHRITENWAEGNAANLGMSIPGTGDGVTWKCAVDTDISDQNKDCATEWGGGNFDGTATDTITITNGQEGAYVEFDVTADVQDFLDGTEQNHGWIIKKTLEGQSGRLQFTSSEGITNNPELVIFFG